MADVEAHLEIARRAQRIAWTALSVGAAIMLLKFAVFALTNSAAVLSDAMESIVNLVAAGVATVSTWYAAQPPDAEHPYGHGKVEFVAVGFEGAMVVVAGGFILFEATRRLIIGPDVRELELGFWLLLGVNVIMAALAVYVYAMGRRLESPTLVADGKHLATDVVTTFGVCGGLLAVQMTGRVWLDSAVAIAVALLIFITGFRLLRESWRGLVDQADPKDEAAVQRILDDAVTSGEILGYHKVRLRHNGAFHWVDLHLQLPGEMPVREAHEVATRIETRIEQRLGRADATAHVEPPENIGRV